MSDTLCEIPWNFGTFPDPRKDEREWGVWYPHAEPDWLLLVCAKTKAKGVVKDPSEEEWKDSLDAYDWAYRWPDNARVTLIEEGRE